METCSFFMEINSAPNFGPPELTLTNGYHPCAPGAAGRQHCQGLEAEQSTQSTVHHMKKSLWLDTESWDLLVAIENISTNIGRNVMSHWQGVNIMITCGTPIYVIICLYVFPWTPSWLSTDWLPVSRLQTLEIACCERQANEVNAMACLPGSRKGASNMGDTSSSLQAKFLLRCKWMYREGVFTWDILQVLLLLSWKIKQSSLTCKSYVCLVTADANCKLDLPPQLLPCQNHIAGKKPRLLQQRAMVGPPQGDVNHPIQPKEDTWFYRRVEVSFSGVGSLESTWKGNRSFFIRLPAVNFSSGSMVKSGDFKINHLDTAL